MATANGERRLPDGQKWRESDVNADASTVGDILTSVDDGSGGKTAQWQPPAVTPDDTDPGVPLGTPGNKLLHFIVESGDDETLVLGRHGVDLEHIPAGWIRENLQAGAQVRGQATIAVKGALTAYLEVKYSTDNGLTWPDGQVLGVAVPLGGVTPIPGTEYAHAVGLAVDIPAGAAGDILMRPACGGGNGIDCPEIVNFIVRVTSGDQPDDDGEDGPITPEIPTTNPVLLADWDPTEGSGSTLADKS